ncbi:protein of unknown function (plasmid) [Cupriavidus taiwanensis]|uniref:Uncharacterized protein n=1 Tax=Cupriavidus taiwanensis TaxID=164546 RepID=A0A375EDC6_9BURK|nr:protein of unknown function [Cupriavidus taiwanensis]SOZ72390.1 protein of unknown function [Cupriavidus taiwanensis]SOZ74734.1 protein of unknown function [Cupriavidus taiwanensis]SPA11493.1 protein of unknown function [Cupriavidus taiwanensis]SPD49223.1 protein of unknown function [Cupriavidus taiwanensis]
MPADTRNSDRAWRLRPSNQSPLAAVVAQPHGLLSARDLTECGAPRRVWNARGCSVADGGRYYAHVRATRTLVSVRVTLDASTLGEYSHMLVKRSPP